MNSDNPCPCTSGLAFGQCCQDFINLVQPTPSAETLMRSRFSAFCLGDIDYLIQTHHPKQHKPDDREILAKSMANCQWLSLSIVKTKRGNASDTTGEVSFVASFTENGEFRQLYEHSRFVKEQDQWLYTDGDIIDTIPKEHQWQRNRACWCGSGKKFKVCHNK